MVYDDNNNNLHITYDICAAGPWSWYHRRWPAAVVLGVGEKKSDGKRDHC